MGRNPVGKVEERLEELLLAFPVKLNGHERICTTDDSQQRQHKDARQRMLTRSFDARVRNTLKVLKNRLCREFVLHVTCPLASPARNPVAREHTNDARSKVSSNRSKLLHVWRDSPEWGVTVRLRIVLVAREGFAPAVSKHGEILKSSTLAFIVLQSNQISARVLTTFAQGSAGSGSGITWSSIGRRITAFVSFGFSTNACFRNVTSRTTTARTQDRDSVWSQWRARAQL